MTVRYFEDLEIWKLARKLTKEIYTVTRREPFSKDYGLVDQIRRASVSIMSNIAEGFERGGNQEFIQFLSIAKGSSGEVRCQLYVALDQNYIDQQQFKNLSEMVKKISIMINNFIQYLKGSRFRGQKFKKPPRKSLQEEMKEILEQFNRRNAKTE
ncbi:MAG: four helix bundle protein [Candidatus Aminicenantia bacterium]